MGDETSSVPDWHSILIIFDIEHLIRILRSVRKCDLITILLLLLKLYFLPPLHPHRIDIISSSIHASSTHHDRITHLGNSFRVRGTRHRIWARRWHRFVYTFVDQRLDPIGHTLIVYIQSRMSHHVTPPFIIIVYISSSTEVVPIYDLCRSPAVLWPIEM